MKINNEDIQNRVMDKTREMVINRGLKGWNMVDLAKETGLAKQTLYRIIGSKENIIEKVVLAQMEFTFGNFNRIFEKNLPYPETLALLYKKVPEFITTGTRVTLPEIYREYPSIEKKALAFEKKISTQLIAFLKRGIEENYFRADVDPKFLFDLMRGGILEHYLRAGLTGEALKDAVKKAFSYLLIGVRTNAP